MNAKAIVLEKFDTTETYTGIKQFDCGHKVINRFASNSLKNNVQNDMCQAYVLLDTSENDKFIGYDNVMAFSVDKKEFDTPPKGATSRIPVLRLVMLGVDTKYSGHGLGKQLLAHVLDLTLSLATQIGIAGLYLDAEEGRHSFYRQLGFEGISTPHTGTNILPMFISIETIKNALKK